MEFEQMLELIRTVSNCRVSHFTYEKDGEKLSVACKKESREIIPEAEPVVTTAQKTQEIANQPEKYVKSPLVGVFYTAPAEDAAPFVKVGDHIKAGQVVAIVEAMKLMNEIEAETEGTVTEILAENGKAVEYGQPLFRLA